MTERILLTNKKQATLEKEALLLEEIRQYIINAIARFNATSDFTVNWDKPLQPRVHYEYVEAEKGFEVTTIKKDSKPDIPDEFIVDGTLPAHKLLLDRTFVRCMLIMIDKAPLISLEEIKNQVDNLN